MRFGTDGMRGDARSELGVDITAALGRAAVEVLGGEVAVGRDTRESGPELAAAFHAGVAASGGASVDLGVVPTPAVARWCAAEDVAGAMISASHNPWHDNGVKLFAPGGRKLTDAMQDAVQTRFDALLHEPPPPAAATIVDRHLDAVERHVAGVVASIAPRTLGGLRVVIDAGHGAASPVVADVFDRLEADAEVINAAPDGRNINAGCGSTDPSGLRHEVMRRKADLGVAFDGDADRLVAVDTAGEIVDGDQIIAVCARDMSARGILRHDAVVATVMANLGFRRGMAAVGIEVVETPVGDRHVLEALEAGGYSLGGEQSGHVIFADLAGTGDGILSAVQLADVVARSETPLATLAATAMTRLPQVLRNVVVEGDAQAVVARLQPAVDEAVADLGERGRVLVRPSGTEPLVRVMVEAETDDEAAATADAIVTAMDSGGPPPPVH